MCALHAQTDDHIILTLWFLYTHGSPIVARPAMKLKLINACGAPWMALRSFTLEYLNINQLSVIAMIGNMNV